MKSQKNSSHRIVIIVMLNLFLVATLIFTFMLYKEDYENKLYAQNLNDIGNINHSAASVSGEILASAQRKLEDTSEYAKIHKLTMDEVLKYLDETNRGGKRNIQIIGSDLKGYYATPDENGKYAEISYTNDSYRSFRKIFSPDDCSDSQVYFSSEFTDASSSKRSFALYSYIPVYDENGNATYYTLMTVYETNEFLSSINSDGGFDDLSTILIDKDGNYIIRTADFTSNNFFHYIASYNELSLDEENELKIGTNSEPSGSFIYSDKYERKCVFSYYSIEDTNWYCVTAVPLSSFHTTNIDIKYSIIQLLILIFIMFINFAWMIQMNIGSKRAIEEAKHANAAKSDFLARMSHDIRTPINVINGMAELALHEDDRTEVDSDLHNIQTSGKFLLCLVNDVLDMEKVESGKMELNPAKYAHQEFLEYINAIIRPLCDEKHIEFTVKGNMSDETAIFVDSMRFNQIFFNLLSNAVKFTPEGGHISLVGNFSDETDNKAVFSFSISDDGCGMSHEFQENMFSAFSQEKRTLNNNITGTGLGLSIVKSIVELMNGSIEVESEVDEGTTFYISMPVEIIKNTDTPTPSEEHHASLEGRHILLCEDHPLNAKIMIKLLSDRSVNVDWAENGQMGVEKFNASEEYYYDVVLMDILMPVMDGLEAAKAIRALDISRNDATTVPIVALTANAYDHDVQNSIDAGMNAHLAKPVDIDKLCELLEKLIGERENY